MTAPQLDTTARSARPESAIRSDATLRLSGWRRGARGVTLLLLLVVTLALLASQAAAQAVPTKHALFGKARPAAGDYEEWILQGGQPRTFRVHIPPRYSQSIPLPLLLVLHDTGGDARSAQTATRVDPDADKADFIVVYPNATGSPATWIFPGCCGASVETGSIDLTFLGALIDELVATLRVDTSRIGLAGIGSGASLALAAAPQLSGKLAVVVSVAGSLPAAPGGGPLVSLPALFSPVSVLAIHARDDSAVRLEGAGTDAAGAALMPVTEAIGYMARLNRCGATPNRDGASTDAVVLQTYSGCLDAVDVALYTLAAGGHAWPQGHLLGAASPAATILDFIVRHPKS